MKAEMVGSKIILISDFGILQGSVLFPFLFNNLYD